MLRPSLPGFGVGHAEHSELAASGALGRGEGRGGAEGENRRTNQRELCADGGRSTRALRLQLGRNVRLDVSGRPPALGGQAGPAWGVFATVSSQNAENWGGRPKFETITVFLGLYTKHRCYKIASDENRKI